LERIVRLPGFKTVTVADALAAGFATLVAVTVMDVVEVAAENSPVVDMVPPVADHATPTRLVPLTIAVNCTVPPGEICALVGEICTPTPDCWLFAVEEFAPETEEQELMKRIVENRISTKAISCFATRQLSWRSFA
jgi:hypothetical protein